MRKKKKQKLKEQQFWGTFAYFSKPQLPDSIPKHLDGSISEYGIMRTMNTLT